MPPSARTQLARAAAYVMRSATSTHTTTIEQNGQVRGMDDVKSLWSALKSRSRSFISLKKTPLWAVAKDVFRDYVMYRLEKRITGPITMPRNRKGAGGGLAPGYGGERIRRKGGPRMYLNIDLRRQGIRIYSTRPYPPEPDRDLTNFIKTILGMWIVRGT